MRYHVVLLGDSIFDNGPYVGSGETVLDHLTAMLPAKCRATLLAVDGAVVSSVYDQITRIPADATHLVLSNGGNDALQVSASVFGNRASSVQGALSNLGQSVVEFSDEYAHLLGKLRDLKLPLAVCTVYDAVPGLELAEKTGLSLFNDFITRSVIAGGERLIDLRGICVEPEDYSLVSPIEPSSQGGAKIARAILSEPPLVRKFFED